MKVLRAVLAGVLLAAGIVGLAPAHRALAAGQLTLVSQDFNLATDGLLRFVVEFPDDVQVTSIPNATMVVTAYRAVSTREAVADALDGTLPRSADSVDLPLSQLARTAANSVQGVVQLESVTRTPESLQLSQPGLYPLTLEVRDGNEVVAELITLVNLLPSADSSSSSSDDLRVALAMHTTAPVRLDGEGEVIIDDDVVNELTHLADALDAIAPTNVPATISVPPALLAALTTNDQVELADRLSAALARHELLSAPRLPLDASQAADAGEQALYTEWLRDGDDILTAVSASPSVRTVTFVESAIDQGGASLHRDLGSRLLVIPRDLYDQLPGSLGASTDTSQLVTIEVTDGVRMDATVPDQNASDLLATDTDQPALTAISVVADLLAARQEMIDDDEIPSHRGVTLATPDLALPPTITLAAIAELLAATPGLNATTLEDIAVRTDQLTDEGDLVIVGLPTTVPGSLTARLAPVANLELESIATASMLPTDDARMSEWTRSIDQLPTSALTDAQVTLIVTDLQKQFLAIRESVEIPPGFSFTLTGRRTTVPIKMHNSSETPLTVRVRLTSSKLLFPGGDQTVTLPPQAFFDVEIPIEVRTNGRFPVTLEVFTPTGDLHLAPPVKLTARVNAISGLGNLVTGALLLVVMTWWARHVRQNWRRRAALKASLHHPLRGGDH
ncbi:MAG: DUF6049 family protein [Ilumatobacteraceae bacterium]